MEERREPPSSAKYERGGAELGGDVKCGLREEVYWGKGGSSPHPCSASLSSSLPSLLTQGEAPTNWKTLRCCSCPLQGKQF